ncbi:MAG: Nif3-like dinuclear metal center hexameric protein [Ruminococcus sp.]|nr:Nif3-like dinuclear metal center hexameric protein [Ruminococcus sp.]
MKIADILNFFEEFAPVATAMDFDNCGLLVGDKNTKVHKVLLALDITADVVTEAESLGCDLIISHHPIIFSPLKKLSAASVVYQLAAKGISAVCMHTNLDLSQEFGVNICLAKAVGVENPVLSENGECMFIGELASETDIDAFAQCVKEKLGCAGLRYTHGNGKVKKVAVSSGSGGSNVYAAKAEGADAILIGEIKHHEIIDANSMGLAIIDAGHFRTEDVVIAPLCEKLNNKFEQVEFIKSKVCNDNLRYI